MKIATNGNTVLLEDTISTVQASFLYKDLKDKTLDQIAHLDINREKKIRDFIYIFTERVHATRIMVTVPYVKFAFFFDTSNFKEYGCFQCNTYILDDGNASISLSKDYRKFLATRIIKVPNNIFSTDPMLGLLQGFACEEFAKLYIEHNKVF